MATITAIGLAATFAMVCSASFALDQVVKREIAANAQEILEGTKEAPKSPFFNMAKAKLMKNPIPENQITLTKLSQSYKISEHGGEQVYKPDGLWWSWTLVNNEPLKRNLGLLGENLMSMYQIDLGQSPSLTKYAARSHGIAIQIREFLDGPSIIYANKSTMPIWVAQKDPCRYVDTAKLTCTSADGEYQLDVKQNGDYTLVTVKEPDVEPFYLF
ncbi:hypothetical protein [Pseudomonas baetica]|uniref:hypothetical protein n=1 Tax=Pseudomonas baetica TaxID=674054 RepID=UPI0024071456|nr:hypothetical protein [Pseudomonas baetica]MDF9779056.1 hypothetical protein [Pseudomonas baetica]